MSTDNLLLRERQALILARLRSDGRVLAPDLALALNVSEDTIRRDLRDLAAAGLCQKVYGGALSLPLPPDQGSLTERSALQTAGKSLLASTAATVVKAGNVLFIDAGSTNLSIAAALPDLPLTVVTNAPAVAALLLGRPGLDLIMLGGRVDPRSGACLGEAALREVELIRPDWFFLGACGADADAGVTAFDFDEAAFKRRVAAVSKAVLVAATIDKLGTAAPYAVLASKRLSHLVIEHDADAGLADAFAALGVQVLRAAQTGAAADVAKVAP